MLSNDFLFVGLFIFLAGLGVVLPAFIKDGLSQLIYRRPSVLGYTDVALFFGIVMVIIGMGIASVGGLIVIYKELVF